MIPWSINCPPRAAGSLPPARQALGRDRRQWFRLGALHTRWPHPPGHSPAAAMMDLLSSGTACRRGEGPLSVAEHVCLLCWQGPAVTCGDTSACPTTGASTTNASTTACVRKVSLDSPRRGGAGRRPSSSEAGSARSKWEDEISWGGGPRACGEGGVGESLGSRHREQGKLCSVPSQSVNSFSLQFWYRFPDLLFSPLKIQAGLISHDGEAGAGSRERLSLQIRSNPRRLVLSGQNSTPGEAFQV